MRLFFVGVGSNIAPRQNVAAALGRLLDMANPIHISQIMETAPIGISDSGDRFLNLTVAFASGLDDAGLKSRFNAIEAELGRDRTALDRKTRSRPIDLDILGHCAVSARRIPDAMIPPEPYAEPSFTALARYLGLLPGPRQVLDMEGVSIPFGGVAVGRQPCTATRGPAGPVTVTQRETAEASL